MIVGKFHQGSGIGNQLHRYVMTRVLALDKGYEFGMINTELFKGKSFMNLDMGKSLEGVDFKYNFEEKKIVENGIDVRGYDPEINFVRDETIIDGEFQDIKYFGHRLKEIRKWVKVKPFVLDKDVCVINFRGGEYKLFPDLFLTKDYWNEAIEIMESINPDIQFWVVTDDPETAEEFFPNYTVSHRMEHDWTAIRYAHYLILSNSSFGILPALINQKAKKIIAPRYWARHNIGVWALPQNYYPQFEYI